MTVSSCSSSSPVTAIQSQPPKNQAKSNETTNQEPSQDTVHLSAQALNQLKGTDPDGDGH